MHTRIIMNLKSHYGSTSATKSKETRATNTNLTRYNSIFDVSIC